MKSFYDYYGPIWSQFRSNLSFPLLLVKANFLSITYIAKYLRIYLSYQSDNKITPVLRRKLASDQSWQFRKSSLLPALSKQTKTRKSAVCSSTVLGAIYCLRWCGDVTGCDFLVIFFASPLGLTSAKGRDQLSLSERWERREDGPGGW